MSTFMRVQWTWRELSQGVTNGCMGSISALREVKLIGKSKEYVLEKWAKRLLLSENLWSGGIISIWEQQGMSEFRIEKREELVVIFMADGIVYEGSVFLSPFAQHRSGGQTVLDLLMEEQHFLPLKSAKGAFHLVSKGMISHLRYDNQEEPLPCFPEREVTITFLGGEELQGTVCLDLPAENNRIQDFFNTGARYFSMKSSGHDYLVNMNLIQGVVLS